MMWIKMIVPFESVCNLMRYREHMRSMMNSYDWEMKLRGATVQCDNDNEFQ